ncbi:heterodisulfide reductase-related iron-sulfur binding cluster [Maioricimonas sp. JC845]|uniref:(Fe-S)-binding protein n=1 Tax=Maioricimonas sp. JC845 TaxID=3232138 RepID=UPI003459D59F
MAEFASPHSEQTPTGDASVAASPERLGQSIEYERFLDCVHCGLCTSACPTYLETGNENDSPRGRIYLMRAVTDGRLELTDTVSRHLDLCLDCRSCETACPSGVQYGRLIEPFRVEMHEKSQGGAAPTSPPGWFEKWILHGLFPYPSRLKWALAPARLMQLLGLDRLAETIGLTRLLPQKLQRMQRLLPPLQRRGPQLPEVLPARGTQRARVALFTGCVADAMFHHVNRSTARVLQANGCEVVIPRQQTCCGAIHYHSGASEPAMERAAANAAAFPVDDVDAIIVNVAGCGAMLRDYPHIAHELSPDDDSRQDALAKFSSKVRDISEFLMELGPVAPTHDVPMTATYHDACHLCHAQKIRQQPRDLLGLVPGLNLVPLPESDICCGAAGSYNLTEPEMSDRLGQRKLRNIRSTGAEAVISGNAGCTLQIQALLRQDGAPLPVLHPVEILARGYGADTDR